MPKGLNWFQARALARVQKRRIRRDAWHRWLEYDPSVFLWFIFQPPGETRIEEGEPVDIPEKRAVVLAAEFTRDEFLAEDWTDEDWPRPGEANPGNGGTSSTGSPGAGGSGGTGGTGGTGSGSPSGGAGEDAAGGTSDSGGAGSWIIFPGAAGAGGGGGGGGGGVPPKPLPPEQNYAPSIELELEADPDGPGCFIVPPTEATAYVNVTVPNPPGGTVLVLGLSVTCFGQTQTRTVGPGTSGAFTFKGPATAGSKIRATVTANDFKGHTWTVSASANVAPACLLPVFTWAGSETVTHRCNHGSAPVDGYDKAGNYSTSAQYAVNPAVATGATAPKTAVNLNPAQNKHETTTPYPGGSPTTVDSFVAPPGSITCDVDADGNISNVTPASLDLYAETGSETTGIPPNDCTDNREASESGPNGDEDDE